MAPRGKATTIAVLAALLMVLGGWGCDGDGENDNKCAQLVATTIRCYDGWCDGEGEGTQVCGCWAQGMDIDPNSCACIPLNLSLLCQLLPLDLINPALFSCEAATSVLEGICTEEPAG